MRIRKLRMPHHSNQFQSGSDESRSMCKKRTDAITQSKCPTDFHASPLCCTLFHSSSHPCTHLLFCCYWWGAGSHFTKIIDDVYRLHWIFFENRFFPAIILHGALGNRRKKGEIVTSPKIGILHQ